MNHWLIKTEPGTWSWDDQVKQGVEPWDGVRNYQAANNMKSMKNGDFVFFYHSVKERRIVGIVKIVREYYPDVTDSTGRFGRVDVQAIQPMPVPVALADIKANPALAEMILVKNSRLSVQPVTEAQWQEVCKMGQLNRRG